MAELKAGTTIGGYTAIHKGNEKQFNDISTNIKTAGTQTAGTSDLIARADHIHPITAVADIVGLTTIDVVDTTNDSLIIYDASTSSNKKVAPSKSMVGLGNVDNTSDLGKPVSTATQTALNNVIPIGFTYFQLPGESAPNLLFAGTWSDISINFSGAFFRVAGTDADNFQITLGSPQAGQLKQHSHVASSGNDNTEHTHTGSTSTPSLTGSFDGNCDDGNQKTGVFYTATYSGQAGSNGGAGGGLIGINVSHAHTFTSDGRSAYHQHPITINYSEGGTEVRPKNYTIKVWKRIA